MAYTSKGSILSAIGGNTLVMIGKFVGFTFTGSSAMLAESIHSLADVMNQALLLLGLYRSERTPDERYTRGYGRERFVWALISAVGIFFLGCGVTIYHGVSHLLHPTHTLISKTDLIWVVGILIFSFLIEAWVLWVAYKTTMKDATQPFWVHLKEDADPLVIAVLMEDSAACLGILIALFSLVLTHFTGAYYWDAIGSILIGILLGFIAVWLIHRNRQLLVGQSLSRHDELRLLEVMNRKAFIEEVDHVHSESLGANRYEAQIEADFDEDELVKSLDINLKEAYRNIKTEEEFIEFCERYGAESMRLMKDTIKSLERELKEAVPELDYIDIEPQ